MSGFITDVYAATGTVRPGRRFVALIQRPGDLGPHMASTTFGATHDEAARKAADAILSFSNPAKKAKQPPDLDTVPVLTDEDILSD